jgi:hypothetical protein
MQFLHERGYTATLETLTRETKHEMNIEGGGGQLCSILAEYEDMKMMEVSAVVSSSNRALVPRRGSLTPLSQVDESLAALETQLRSAAADGSHVKSCSAVHEVLSRLLSDAPPSAATDALRRRFTTRTSSPSPSAATNLCWQLAPLTALLAYSRSRQWRRRMRCCR